MASMDDLLAGMPRAKLKRKIHKPHKLAVGAGSIRSDINVTPLVDVVLVLLIIFMVVTPMITRGRPVEQPMTRYHDKKTDTGQEIIVSVTCEGGKMGARRWECGASNVYIGTDKLEGQAIGERVLAEMRKKGQGIHLKGDKRASYKAVREAMERINAAGVTNVALGSDEVKE